MVLPNLVRSGSGWFLSSSSVGLMMSGLEVLSSTLFSLGPLIVCVVSSSGSTKWTFFTTTVEFGLIWCFNNVAPGISIFRDDSLRVPCVT